MPARRQRRIAKIDRERGESRAAIHRLNREIELQDYYNKDQRNSGQTYIGETRKKMLTDTLGSELAHSQRLGQKAAILEANLPIWRRFLLWLKGL